MTSFLACVLRARSKTLVAAPIKSAVSVAMMSITTIISISVKAAGFRLLNKFIFSFALVNPRQWLGSALAVLLRRATPKAFASEAARDGATPNVFASAAARQGRAGSVIQRAEDGGRKARSKEAQASGEGVGTLKLARGA